MFSKHSGSSNEEEQLINNRELLDAVIKKNITVEVRIRRINIAIEKGANINFQDRDCKNNTPLHLAVKRNELKTVNHLLTIGSNVTIENEAGKNPLELPEELEYPEIIAASEFLVGKAQEKGDCFFDSLAQGMNQLSFPDGPFTIQSLRLDCFEYARDNANSIYESRKNKSWSQAIADDASLGGYDTKGSDQDKFNSYLVRIKLTAEGMKDFELGAAIWGRPEIEGRMLCRKYKIKIHVIEKQITADRQNVIVHNVEDGSVSRQIDDEKIYNNPLVVHILNEGCAHFVPILRQSSRALEKTSDFPLVVDVQRQDIPKDRLGNTENVGLQAESTRAKRIHNRDKDEEDIFSPKKKDVLPNKNETFPASGVKSTQHGVAYQLKLLMLFAKRCHKKGYSFRLATEMDDAEKFDDVVLQYTKKNDDSMRCIFLQAKHIQVESETKRKITANDLLTETDALFSLQKYFISYQKITNNEKFQLGCHKYFIINTNIGFDFDDDVNVSGVKKLVSLYFEPFTAAIDLVNVGGEYYQLVGSTHKVERQAVMSILKPLFEQTSEFKKLAQALAQHLVDDTEKAIGLDQALFKKYQAALVKDVIDIRGIKIAKKFLKNDPYLSLEVQRFRQTFLEAVEQILTAKPSVKRSKQDEKLLALLTSETPKKNPRWATQELEPFLDEISQIKLKLSDGFKKILVLEENPQLAEPQAFAKEMVRLIVNKKESSDKKITIQNRGKNSLISEIYKLAGHVLIKLDGSVTFSQGFLMGQSPLAGNLATFKTELIQALKKEKIRLDKLDAYRFQITDFETCQEKDFAGLLSTKPNFPEQGITDEAIEEFLNHFIFAVKQPNEEKLGELINQEIGEEFNLIDADLITHDFQKRMFDWLKEKRGRYLSENRMDDFFKALSEKISQLVMMGLTSEYTKKLQETEINFKILPPQLLTFLNQPHQVKIFNLVTEETSTILESIKVNQALKNVAKYHCDDSYIFIQLSTLLRLQTQVMQAFSKSNTHLLIVECKPQEKDIGNLHSELLEKLIHSENKQLLLIALKNNYLVDKFKHNASMQNLEVFDKSSFSDLVLESQKKILKKKVNFQGKKVSLDEIMTDDSNITELLPLAYLVEEKTLEIDKALPISNGYDKAFYIGRTIHPYVEIDQDILTDKKFHGLLAFSKNEFTQLCEKYPNHNIHWLKREPGHPLVWLQSIQSSKALSQYMKIPSKIDTHYLRSYAPEDLKDFICQAQSQKVMLIADTAGTGKSTVLTHLSIEIKNEKPDHWVARIDLNDHTDALKTQANEKLEAVEFLSEKLLKLITPLEKDLFKKCLKDKKVVLMMDGFDEISPTYKKTVTVLLQALKKTSVEQLWVTTRPHLREALVDELQQLTYKLEPFSEDNQIEFLTNFWRYKYNLQEVSKHRLEIYSQAIIKKLTKSIDDQEKALTGIPLQTRMVAESFKDELIIFCNSDEIEPDLPENFDLLDLYEKFIDKKIDIYQEEKNKTPLNNVGALEQRERDNKSLIKIHQQLALQMLITKEQVDLLQQDTFSEFTEEAVARIGIISYINENLNFIHRTFAEYFLSCFLAKNLSENTVQDFLLTEVLINDEFQNIRKFLNSHFLKKLPSNNLIEKYREKVFETCVSNKTIFNTAAKENNAGVLRFLLKSLEKYPETLKNIVVDKEESALQIAASLDHIQFAKEFLSFFQNQKDWSEVKKLVLSKDCEGISLLQKAALNNNIKFIEWFLKYVKKEVDASDTMIELVKLHKNYVKNALHLAAECNKSEIIKLLIENGANKEALSKYNLNALHLAIDRLSFEAVKVLINNGANIKATGYRDHRFSPLHMASSYDNIEIVKFLIEKGAKTEATDKDNNTPLHMAVEDNSFEAVKVLIKNGANIEAAGKDNFTPLHFAVFFNRPKVVKFLIENQANIEATCKNNGTPLHLAVEKSDNEVVEYLISHGANIEAIDEKKRTPLQLAIISDKQEKVKLLVEHNAKIEATGGIGTPLHFAIVHNKPNIVRFLVEQNAKLEATFGELDMTPLYYAVEEGYLEIVKFLIEKGANVFAKTKHDTILHRAAVCNNLELIRLILEAIKSKSKNDPDKICKAINAQDNDGDTPLNWAIEKGQSAAARLLINADADLKITNNEGKTALNVASEKKHWSIVATLVNHGAAITDLTDEQCRLFIEHKESGHYEDNE